MRWQGTNGANGLLRRAAPTVTEHRAAVCGRRTKTHLNEESLDQGRHKYPAHDQYNTTFFHRWSHFVSRDLSDRNFSNKVIYRPLMLGDRLQKGISMNRLIQSQYVYLSRFCLKSFSRSFMCRICHITLASVSYS